MYYPDTNMIIAYGFEEETHHQIAQKAITDLLLLHISLSLVELAVALSRQKKEYRFPPVIEGGEKPWRKGQPNHPMAPQKTQHQQGNIGQGHSPKSSTRKSPLNT